MAYHVATVQILIATDDAYEACDALAEALRPLLRTFEPTSSIVDWRYSDVSSMPEPHNGDGFEYAE